MYAFYLLSLDSSAQFKYIRVIPIYYHFSQPVYTSWAKDGGFGWNLESWVRKKPCRGDVIDNILS